MTTWMGSTSELVLISTSALIRKMRTREWPFVAGGTLATVYPTGLLQYVQ